MGKEAAPCRVVNFDHLVFWVSNAKMIANYYVTRLGFKILAVRQPSEANQNLAYAVKLNKIIIVLESPSVAGGAINQGLTSHGDFVKDIALGVEDLDLTVQSAKDGGAEVVRDILADEDEGGLVKTAVLKTYGDNTHTLIDRSQYKGVFLPGFKAVEDPDVMNKLMPIPDLLYIDHVESNMVDGTLDDSIAWYQKNLQMHRFWCVDYEREITPYSSMRALSVANENESVLLQLKEGAEGLMPSNKSSEYVKCHGGPGVEHICFYTEDILAAMSALKARGAEAVEWPSTYYDIVRENLQDSPVQVREEISELQRLNVLIDFDAKGYLLQAFTKHTQPRATLFLELIQRSPNFKGFGAGNYRTLFDAFERLEAASNADNN